MLTVRRRAGAVAAGAEDLDVVGLDEAVLLGDPAPIGALTVYGDAMGEAERQIAVARSCAATLEDALVITRQRRLGGTVPGALRVLAERLVQNSRTHARRR